MDSNLLSSPNPNVLMTPAQSTSSRSVAGAQSARGGFCLKI